MSNYLPELTCFFWSKLIKKVVASWIEHHERADDLYDRCQSAHRTYNKVHGDISDSLDEGSMDELVLLETYDQYK